jgi:hypothetical protein
MADQPDRNAGVLSENPRSFLRIRHQPYAISHRVHGQWPFFTMIRD